MSAAADVALVVGGIISIVPATAAVQSFNVLTVSHCAYIPIMLVVLEGVLCILSGTVLYCGIVLSFVYVAMVLVLQQILIGRLDGSQ